MIPNMTTKLSAQIEAMNSKNSILTPEDIETIRSQALEPLMEQLILRNQRGAWFKEPIGWTEEFKVDTYAHMNAARIKTMLDSLKVDTRTRSRATYVPVFLLHDFFIPRGDFEVAKQKGIDIVGKHVKESTYQCMLLEDQYLVNGYAEDGTNKNVNGLYQLAGNTVAGSDFGTYGNAVSTVQSAIAALLTDKAYGPWDYFLATTQALQLEVSKHQYSGVLELKHVNQLLDQNGVGKLADGDQATRRIWLIPSLTNETGMMIGSNPEAVEIHETVGLTPELYDVNMTFGRGYYGRVYMGEVLAVNYDEVICTTTGI